MKITYFDFLYIKNKGKRFKSNDWNNDSFDHIMNLISDKDILNNTKLLLRKLLYNQQVDERKFLASFMITTNHSVVVTKDTSTEQKLINISKDLIKLMNVIIDSKNILEMCINIKVFNKIYNKYIDTFDLWKEEDKISMVNNLSLIYFDLEADKQKRYENIDDETNKVFIDNITNEQQKLLEKIELIGGKEALEYLNSLKKEIDDYKKNVEELYNSIDYNMHEAYWNSIKTQLSKEPPNFGIIINLLSELKEMILNCNPKLKKELEENIDVEFIQEMLSRGVIDDKYIRNMSNYIIKIVRDLQSEEYDKELDEWAKNMNETFDKGVKYSEYFPTFFRFIFESISVTQKEMYIYNYIKQKREGEI